MKPRLLHEGAIPQLLADCGLQFAVVPSGTYKVGAKPNVRSPLALKPQETWADSPMMTVLEKVTVGPFAITTEPLRTSHWAKLRQVISVSVGTDAGWDTPQVPWQPEADPVLEWSFADAQALAQATGTSLPRWDEWEIAARGRKSLLYPWGNEIELAKITLEGRGYSNDTESEMGYYSYNQAVTYCRSFGEYADTASPFGLRSLARCDREWNLCHAGKPLNGCDHVLRSLSDLGAMAYMAPGIRPGTWDAHKWLPHVHSTFSGPVLACYAPPTVAGGLYRVAALRLVVREPGSVTET